MKHLRRLGPLLALGLFVAWLLLLRPVGLGGPATYIMVSGHSMEPTLWTGDLVVLKKQDSYAKGEVITYEVPEGDVGAGTLVIHRIIGGDENGFVTQGDNRDEADDWRPTVDDVRGELLFTIPDAGKVLGSLRQPTTAAALAGGATVFLMLLGSPKRRKEDEDDNEVESERELQDA